ncbi:penicillin-binding protein 2 [Vibrio ouci]|uniref:Peptidoglycan D,D-transpeptidase MrdA n=2 Tax=Vibrio ouci TaxID=2499078 RepID=A0A4Y8W934_9VIBR|nr:penicillin-binding protein 2 [Vibrio ouci]
MLAVVVLTLLLLGNFYWIQVHNVDRYQTQADNNRIKLLPLAPTRGRIYDRNRVLLAGNRLIFDVRVIPERIEDMDALLKALRPVLSLNDEQLARFKGRLRRTRPFVPVTLIEDLSDTAIARFSVRQHRFSGVYLDTSLRRVYPYGETLAHVVGYVARINEQDQRRLIAQGKAANYQATPAIGKLGVERYYEDLLHGQQGYQEVEVNSHGRVVRTLHRVAPVPGNDLILNIDIKLQQHVFDQLGQRPGSAIVLDPSDNSVLAMASSPSYDPNLFVEGITHSSYQALLSDPARPLLNRATLGVYPPASTVKPFIAVAGLQERVISATTRRDDQGVWRIPGSEPDSRAWRDWKRWGHGPVDVSTAIEESVNSFFYQTAFDLGIDRIGPWMHRFGFGQPTGIDLHEESQANMPTRAWKESRYRIPWYQGDTVPIGIGQGYWTTTPLQLAKATSVLVNRGQVKPPRLLRAILAPGADWHTQQRQHPSPQPSIEEVSTDIWALSLNAMQRVNHGERGSGRRAFHDAPYLSGGKSGTAQVFSLSDGQDYDVSALDTRLHDQALYTAFAPFEQPDYVATVVIEHGNSGGRVAAPYLRNVFDYAFQLQAEQADVPPSS